MAQDKLPVVKRQLADVFLACWFSVNKTESLLRDVFEDVLTNLRDSSQAWDIQRMYFDYAPDDNDLAFASWRSSDRFFDDTWELIKKRFMAKEYPLGVLNFKPTLFSVAKKLMKKCNAKAPGWVERISKDLKVVV